MKARPRKIICSEVLVLETSISDNPEEMSRIFDHLGEFFAKKSRMYKSRQELKPATGLENLGGDPPLCCHLSALSPPITSLISD